VRGGRGGDLFGGGDGLIPRFPDIDGSFDGNWTTDGLKPFLKLLHQRLKVFDPGSQSNHGPWEVKFSLWSIFIGGLCWVCVHVHFELLVTVPDMTCGFS
jgi:hypothetical protein